MKHTVKHLSPARVVVTVTTGAAELEAAEQVALKKLARELKVDGFRKGKVPVSVAAKHVEPAVLAEETLNNALSKAVAEAFLAEELQVLERPSVEVKKFVPGQELEFTAEADIVPKVTLGNYKKLKAKHEVPNVSAADVEDVLERIRKGFSEKKEVKRAAAMGDETIIDFVGKKDDVAFDGGTGTDYPLTLGSNSFIPGFEEALVGLKPGSTKDVELTFPKEYHAKELAGQKVVFAVTIKKINAVELPKLTDELAAKAGPFKTVAELKADIKKELAAQRQREATDKLKDELVRDLVAKSQVIAPEVLVNDQVGSIEQDMTQNLMYQGMTPEQYYTSKGYKTRDEWLAGEARDLAEMRVKSGLVLAELTKAENITATAEELAANINRYKQQYANNPDMVKRFDEPEVQRELANRLLTEKAVDRLVELNKA